MKKNLFIILLFLAGLNIYGQEFYSINFEAEGVSLENIYVENITKGTSVVLEGADELRLMLNTESVFFNEPGSKKLSIFPNPIKETANFEFYNKNAGIVNIQLTDVTGNKVFEYENILAKGSHTFSLSGISEGSFIISVYTKTDIQTGVLVSLKESKQAIFIKHVKGIKQTGTVNSHAGLVGNSLNANENMSIIEMDYDTGDELRYTAHAEGVEDVVITDSPTENHTYTIYFPELFQCGQPYYDSRNGYIYRTVQIGEQCWFAENLKYLPEGEEFDEAAGGSLTEPFYYVYDFAAGGTWDDLENDSTFINYQTYGILYNWAASMGWDGQGDPPAEGTQGICPEGWHLPTHDDWTTLERNVGSADPETFPYGGATVGFLGIDEGDAIKDPDAGWCFGTPCGTSGFDALPGGRRYSGGIYYGIGTGARWWTSSEWGAGAWRRYLEDVRSEINRFTDYKTFGFSVRCIKD